MILDKSKIPKITCFIFGFLLTVLFAVLTLSVVGYIGISSKRNIAESINESKYYNSVYELIKENTEELAKQAGLPKKVLTDVITQDRVYIGGFKYINDTLKGEKAEINTINMRELLRKNVNDYILNQTDAAISVTDVSLNTVINEIEQEYKNRMELKLIQSLYYLKIKYRSIIMILIPILLALIGFISYLLIKIQVQQHRGVRLITYSLIASSILMEIIGLVLCFIRPLGGLEVSPVYYRDFIEVWLQKGIKIFLSMGEVGLTISLALILCTGYLKSKVIEK